MPNGPGAGVAATVSPGQRTVVPVAFGTPGFCLLTQPIHFQTAGSWVAPIADHLAGYAAVVDRLTRSAASRLLVVGHTDDQGGDAVNDPLSARRARAVLAVLTGATAEWEEIFRAERVDGGPTPWGRDAFSAMLAQTGAPATPAAVDQHRAPTADGQARRSTLFAAYFRVLLSAPSSPVAVRSTTPAFLGCGEHHVLAPGNHPASRRAEFVFFSGTGTPAITSPAYPGWRNPCAPVPRPRPPQPAVAAFHVSPAGSDAAGDGSLGAPWRTFARSFAEIRRLRQPGQEVTLYVLGGTYDETIHLPSAVTVEGVGTPLPVVRADDAGPALLASGTRDSVVRRLRLTRGTRSGVRVENADGVVVRDCEVAGNTGPRGGGVSIVDSTHVTVENCVIEQNRAGTIEQAITAAVLDILPPDFAVTLGDSHGGGVYVADSPYVAVISNQIRENRAILFGGGIAVDNRPGFAGPIEIAANEITCNQVAHGPLARLGPAPASCGESMGDPVTLRIASEIPVIGGVTALAALMAAEKAVPLLHGVGRESGLGGGVALRHVSSATRLMSNFIGQEGRGNRARRGGGVACYTGAYPTMGGNEIAFNLASDDGGGIAVDEFDPFLPQAQPAFLAFRRGAMVPRQTIRMDGNTLQGNACIEDGGGMYATGGALLEVTGGTVGGNRAGQNGGGIRISYATVLHAADVAIHGNQCNVIDAEREGGGGVAARNACFHLERCDLSDNVAHGFAGGGIFCTSTFEGGFGLTGFVANRPGQFDEVMAEDHGFSERHYRLTDARGGGNQALGASGAGGYLYALRDPGVSDDVPLGGDQPLRVTLDGAATSIGACTSEYDNPNPAIGRRKRANLTIELSGRADADWRPADRVVITGLPPLPGSVALSTPAPDGKAIVVLNGGGAPDDVPATFPYQNVHPRVVDVQPRFGAAAGATRVSLTVDAVLPGTQVSFDGAAATVVTATATEVRVDTPAHAAGVVDVVLGNPDGKHDTVVGGFEYVILALSAVTPAVGAADRSTAVTLLGTGFLPGVRVFVGSQPCPVLQRVGHAELRVTVPPSPTGVADVADVVVINPGNETATRASGFQWAPRPHITDVQPRGGAPGGGSHLRVVGMNFGAGSLLRIGGRPAAVGAASATSIQAVVPPRGSGPTAADVEVENPDGLTDTVPGGFTYVNGPVITGLLPPSGPLSGGTAVSVLGTGFTTGSRVRFGAVTAPAVFVSPMELAAQSPPLSFPGPPGPVDVTVENPDGQLDTVPLAFTYA